MQISFSIINEYQMETTKYMTTNSKFSEQPPNTHKTAANQQYTGNNEIVSHHLHGHRQLTLAIKSTIFIHTTQPSSSSKICFRFPNCPANQLYIHLQASESQYGTIYVQFYSNHRTFQYNEYEYIWCEKILSELHIYISIYIYILLYIHLQISTKNILLYTQHCVK